MFSHIMIGTNDLDKAKSFYDALLGTLGVPPGRVDRHRIFWRTKTGTFSVTKPINGEAACCANGGTIGFAAESRRRRQRVPRRRPRPWRQDLRGPARHPRRQPASSSTSPICATPTATSSAPCTGCRRRFPPLPRPRSCGERVGVRGSLRWCSPSIDLYPLDAGSRSGDAHPTSPRKRGEVICAIEDFP